MGDVGKILLDTPRWMYSPRNTDWQLKRLLAREFAAEGVAFPRGIAYSFVYNFDLVFARFVPARWRAGWQVRFSRLRAWLLGLERPDIVISQGPYPACRPGYKTIWETYFLPPQKGDAAERGTFERGGTDLWIRQMETFGAKVARIGVRGLVSVNLLKSMYPEYAAKVVDLPFITEEFDIAAEADVAAKQSAEGPVEILFVGREAKRKGLDIALDALKRLRDEGSTNFHFTIVSTLRDGAVDIPKEDWVTYIPELPHAEVMKLFRRAQVFVMPSRFESYGLVYQEAMASGCVAVVRDEDPQREFVDNGRAGVCADEWSPEDIKEKMRPLLQDAALREELALAGVRRYRQMFSLEVRRAKWLNCMREVVGVESRSRES